MADRNKNLGNQQYGDQEWEKRRNRFNQKNEFNQQQGSGYGFYDQNTGVNLGGGNMGNTGGYSGQVSRDQNSEGQGIYNGGNYNNGGYNSGGYNNGGYNSGEYNSGGYNSGNAYQNENNRVNYIPDNDDNRDDYDQEQYNRQQANRYANQGYKSDFEKHYYGQNKNHGNYVDGYDEEQNRRQPRNRYGGDTSNYGNANQGGFDRDWWNRTKDQVASWFGDEDAERRLKKEKKNSGSFYGKGPKNYKRADHRILEDVCDRLTDDDLVDASDIEVSVNGAEVTLTGFVTTRDQKRRAEDVADSVAGVTHVENRLRVGSGTGTTLGTSDTV